MDQNLGSSLRASAVQDPAPPSERALAARHAAVSLVGFAVDAAVLRGAIALGLEPAWARVASLALAMHVTFLANGCFVFRCLRRDRGLLRQWFAYLLANAFGNLCNYWIFVTLVSLHRPWLSRPIVALACASLTAWGINYAGARLLVFGAELRRRHPKAAGEAGPRRSGAARRPASRCGPSPGAPGSSPR